jgi:hypothetical protein
MIQIQIANVTGRILRVNNQDRPNNAHGDVELTPHRISLVNNQGEEEHFELDVGTFDAGQDYTARFDGAIHFEDDEGFEVLYIPVDNED